MRGLNFAIYRVLPMLLVVESECSTYLSSMAYVPRSSCDWRQKAHAPISACKKFSGHQHQHQHEHQQHHQHQHQYSISISISISINIIIIIFIVIRSCFDSRGCSSVVLELNLSLLCFRTQRVLLTFSGPCFVMELESPDWSVLNSQTPEKYPVIEIAFRNGVWWQLPKWMSDMKLTWATHGIGGTNAMVPGGQIMRRQRASAGIC